LKKIAPNNNNDITLYHPNRKISPNLVTLQCSLWEFVTLNTKLLPTVCIELLICGAIK
jgi:hypothetical protein